MGYANARVIIILIMLIIAFNVHYHVLNVLIPLLIAHNAMMSIWLLMEVINVSAIMDIILAEIIAYSVPVLASAVHQPFIALNVQQQVIGL